MTKKILACCLTLGLFAAANAALAADAKVKAKPEAVEKTGVIEITKADAAKKEKFDTIILKVGEEAIKLLPGNTPDHKRAFKGLNDLGGKEVTVTGDLLPANPPKYPMAAIKVSSFKEAAKTPVAAHVAAPVAAPVPGKK